MDDVEKKKLEESLLFTQAEIRALAQGFQDSYFKVDEDGCILDCQAEDETLIGKRMPEVMPFSAGQIFAEAIPQVKETGQKVSIHYWLSMAGNNRHFEARLVPFQDNQIVIIVRDTTEQTLTEESLMAVADVIESMCSHRPYRPALGIQKALAELKQNKGILYDPVVVEACIEVFDKHDFKFD